MRKFKIVFIENRVMLFQQLKIISSLVITKLEFSFPRYSLRKASFVVVVFAIILFTNEIQSWFIQFDNYSKTTTNHHTDQIISIIAFIL